MVIHPFEPVYNSHSQILILGTFPSVKSRAMDFYYAHPQNRFWKVLSSITGCDQPDTIREKIEFLHLKNIALWDVVKSCYIEASKDSTIKNSVANDLSVIFKNSCIKAVFTNGKKAGELYQKLCYPSTLIKSHILPSTSSANGHYSLESLIRKWSVILEYIK